MKLKLWLSRILLIIGLVLCSYPLVSSIYHQKLQDDIISTYSSKIDNINQIKLKQALDIAKQYNEELYLGITDLGYDELLNINDTNIMATLEIPKIDLELPIYHGTDDEVLSNGAGHLKTSSLPIGGNNTRSILMGHRGLPNAKLFTRLDELEIDDLFYIHVFGETLAYKINDIQVVEPDKINDLKIIPDQDLVTLVTCTPYGINSHRLVITGTRTTYDEDTKDKIKATPMSWRELLFTVLPFVMIIMVMIDILVRRKNAKLKKT